MAEISEMLILGVIGLSAGLVGGMLGVGGSIIMIPALTEATGPNQHLYQAAAMIVNFFVVVPAVFHHRRAGTIDASTVVRLVPPAIVAVIVGVGISELPVFAEAGEAYLRLLFGLFLLSAAGYDIYRLYRRSDVHRTEPAWEGARPAAHGGDHRWRLIAVAVPTGLVAGLLGIGGGLLAVPLQRRVLHIPLRVAIANSATVIIATSFVGAGVKNYAYVVEHDYTLRSFVLAGVLIPTAIVGSMCGSRLTYRLPLRLVKTAFFILLAVAAVRLTRGATRSLGMCLSRVPLAAFPVLKPGRLPHHLFRGLLGVHCALRPADSRSRLRAPFHQRLRRLGHLHRRSDCYPLERKLPGGYPPTENTLLVTAHFNRLLDRSTGVWYKSASLADDGLCLRVPNRWIPYMSVHLDARPSLRRFRAG